MSVYVVSPGLVAVDEKHFRQLLMIMMAITLCLCLFIFLTRLPEISRKIIVQEPPQFAQLVLPKVKPKVKPKILPEAPLIPKIDTAKKVPAPELKDAIEAPVVQTVRQAKEKAQLSGLLAFQDEFAEMRAELNVASLVNTHAIQKGRGAAAQLDRSLLVATEGTRRASVNLNNVSKQVGGIALAGRSTTRVQAPQEEESMVAGAVRLVTRQVKSERSIEKVRMVFDANKGAIYAIYNRALRVNPGLLGKVVLELVIEPDGHVSACRVISTDMEDQEMVKKLVRRVQMFNFGEGDVAVTKISYPVHFLPT